MVSIAQQVRLAIAILTYADWNDRVVLDANGVLQDHVRPRISSSDLPCIAMIILAIFEDLISELFSSFR